MTGEASPAPNPPRVSPSGGAVLLTVARPESWR